MPYDATITEQPIRALIDLRGGESAREAFSSALDLALPREPNTARGRDGVWALWLGPDEWLIVAPDKRERLLEDSLRRAAGGLQAAVTAVSDSYAIFQVSGPEARDVLAQGTSLDLHPRLFGPGHCARSVFAKTKALIHQIDDVPTYDLYFDVSFANYVTRWFDTARGR